MKGGATSIVQLSWTKVNLLKKLSLLQSAQTFADHFHQNDGASLSSQFFSHDFSKEMQFLPLEHKKDGKMQ